MKKIITLATIMASLLLVSACDPQERPSPLDTQSSNAMGLDGADIPSDGHGTSDAGLNDRTEGNLGFNPDAIPPEMIICTIYFGFDQYAIPSAERAKLKAVADAMKANPSARIVCVGRTDWYGTEEYNLLLSDKRGNAVSEYVSGLGASAGSLEVVARGKATATPDVAKDSAQAKNDRRVDVVDASKK